MSLEEIYDIILSKRRIYAVKSAIEERRHQLALVNKK